MFVAGNYVLRREGTPAAERTISASLRKRIAAADVVLQNYLSDSRARKLRREYMRDQLAVAFEWDRGLF